MARNTSRMIQNQSQSVYFLKLPGGGGDMPPNPLSEDMLKHPSLSMPTFAVSPANLKTLYEPLAVV